MGRAEDIFENIKQNGENAIDQFIATRKSEELFFDYKLSADNGAGRKLHDNDRNNLAKAISGFGNSEGGVVVWGVDCRTNSSGADVPDKSRPIEDVDKFVSWLEGSVSGCTVPPHSGVRSIPVKIGTTNKGFVASYIPKSNSAPHQMVGTLQYYMRAGSNFMPVPHGVLAGMFGRRPQPNVYHRPAILPARLVQGRYMQIDTSFLIHNEGPGIAYDLFFNIMVHYQPGAQCVINMKSINDGCWVCWNTVGRQFSMISQPHIRLAPESYIDSMVMEILLQPPFDSPLHIEGICGSGGAPPYKFSLVRNQSEVEGIYNEFIQRSQSLTENELNDFSERIMNMETRLSP